MWESKPPVDNTPIDQPPRAELLAQSNENKTTPDREPEIEDKDSQPPNGGYGWVCTACVALINAHTWGINSSYGVFLAHYLSTDA